MLIVSPFFLSVSRRRYHQRFRCTTEQNGSWAFITNRVQIILIYKHLTYTFILFVFHSEGQWKRARLF